ncbi:MAG: signal recognition particle subunit SRP19/SEC65 family protein [Thermoplasmata archaeon]|nr:signal recognition particle subunit SRP19/SEC65 family protein [Thermoplasmata archaeon]
MPDHFYVYPAYLEKEGSRALGRRIPSTIAVPEVTAEMIVAAARQLGFQAEAEPNKQYPRQVQKYGGRVKIAKQAGITKTEAIRRIATSLRESAPPTKSG